MKAKEKAKEQVGALYEKLRNEPNDGKAAENVRKLAIDLTSGGEGGLNPEALASQLLSQPPSKVYLTQCA